MRIDDNGDCSSYGMRYDLERFVQSAGEKQFSLLDNVTQPDPILLCDIVSKRPFSVDNRRVEPIYLRGADVSQPKNKPRVLKS